MTAQVEAAGSRPVTALRGVGEQLAARLARLGIERVGDLLFHLPARYQDRTRRTAIGALAPGADALVIGRIELTEVTRGRRRSLLVRISDGTGTLTMRLFHFSASQQRALGRGRWLRMYGEVRRGPLGRELVHPEYAVFDEEPAPASSDTLTAIYPSTEGLGQGWLRRLTDEALARCLPTVEDLVPAAVTGPLGLPSLAEALAYVHRPPVDADLALLAAGQHPAQQRLAFEELLGHHLSLRVLRSRRAAQGAPAMRPGSDAVGEFLAELPFELTAAQRRVADEVLRDLAGSRPMLRLVQGDVGCGKTVVAAVATVHALAAGYQVAVMAPTEILAEQHQASFREWLEPLGVEIAWLAGKVGGAARREMLERLAGGEAGVAIGTHALFQAGVAFSRLGLVIVDEQHRFGVDQRLALREKGAADGRVPHQLVMTATPIPRTLAMTFYADLDVSSIDELPPGRLPVETVVVPDSRREEVVERVRHACSDGRQVYWVCPAIDESEAMPLQAASETERLIAEALPDLRVGLVHGRMRPAGKERVMRRFREGELDLLVSTTVVEVGVDVPQASVMIIENAERLGLSQLHQLRGRIGRGGRAGTCVLMYHAPLGEHARARLSAIRATTDGFEIARRDLELRGPGELLGTRQTGLQQFRVADLARDRELLPQVERAGRVVLERHPDAAQALIRRWVSHGEGYGGV